MTTQCTKQLGLYKKFYKITAARIQPASDTPTAAPTRETDEPSKPIGIINEEMECFRIVMDIRDELSMISSIFSDQERVMKNLTRTIQELRSGVTKTPVSQPTKTASQPIETTGPSSDTKDQPKKMTDQLDAMRSQPSEVELGIMRWKLRISNIDQRA